MKRITVIRTSGKRFIWAYRNEYGTMFGINLIPGFWGIALNVAR